MVELFQLSCIWMTFLFFLCLTGSAKSRFWPSRTVRLRLWSESQSSKGIQIGRNKHKNKTELGLTRTIRTNTQESLERCEERTWGPDTGRMGNIRHGCTDQWWWETLDRNIRKSTQHHQKKKKKERQNTEPNEMTKLRWMDLDTLHFFEQLLNKFGIIGSHFYRYLHLILNFTSSHSNWFVLCCECSPLKLFKFFLEKNLV